MNAVSKNSSTSRPLSTFELAFYGETARVVLPTSYEELLDIVRDAEARKIPLVPAGVGAHAYLGNPPPPEALIVSTARLDQVLRYEPGDFTIGVQAGLPLGELQKILSEKGQEIPIDLPAQPQGTVGGLVASAQPGPRRGRYGPVRHSVIGMHAVRGGPSYYKTGGMVVKNVAGYEVASFLTGSLGTASVLLEINFKLRPLPGQRAAGMASFASAEQAWEFARNLRSSHLEPASLWLFRGGDKLHSWPPCLSGEEKRSPVVWTLEGNSATIAWQEAQVDALLASQPPETFTSLSAPDLSNYTDRLCEFPSPGDTARDDLGIVRLAVLPSATQRLTEDILKAFDDSELELSLATDALSGLITMRWVGEPDRIEEPLPILSALVRDAGGTGTLLYLPPSHRRAHRYLLVPDPNAAVAKKFLKALDPQGIFSPGRRG